MNAVLSLENIHAGYGDTLILRGVSLSVGDGEIVVIIGPNGAGKSTCLKAIVGLVTVTAGKVTFDGEPLTGLAVEAVIDRGLAFVPQTNNIFPSLTVEENLRMGGFKLAGSVKERLGAIYDLLPQLAGMRNKAAGALSGGQRQMVAIARALVLKPRLLMLDEPTAGLSPIVRREIFRLIRDICSSGTPILMVEQNVREALHCADRGYLLVEGTNRSEGRTAEILENRELGKLFLGEVSYGNVNGLDDGGIAVG